MYKPFWETDMFPLCVLFYLQFQCSVRGDFSGFAEFVRYFCSVKDLKTSLMFLLKLVKHLNSWNPPVDGSREQCEFRGKSKQQRIVQLAMDRTRNKAASPILTPIGRYINGAALVTVILTASISTAGASLWASNMLTWWQREAEAPVSCCTCSVLSLWYVTRLQTV